MTNPHSTFALWGCYLFARIDFDYLTQVPESGNALLCCFLLFVVFILQVHSVRTALTALNLNIPTALVGQHTCTSAAMAFFQFN